MFVFVWMISVCSFKMLHYVAFKGSYVSYDFLSLFLPGLIEIVSATCLSDRLCIVYVVPPAPPRPDGLDTQYSLFRCFLFSGCILQTSVDFIHRADLKTATSVLCS